MTKIIQPLTREFLQTHGVEFNGATWSDKNQMFELTATDEENAWMVTIPELPANIPQPAPIRNYSDLMRLYLSVMGGYIQKVQTGMKFTDSRERFQDMANRLSEFFSFDPNVSLRLNVSVQGVGIAPANAYTHTLLGGNEFEFIIEVRINGESKTLEHNIAPECMSTKYIDKLVRDNFELSESDDVDIIQVWINNQSIREKFFGSGIDFDRFAHN